MAQQRISGRPIEIGYAWRQRLRWATEQFGPGATLRAHVRARRNDKTILAELTTANGGLVIVSTTEVDIVLSAAATATMKEGSVVTDLIRTDASPVSPIGITITIPVQLPVTRDQT